MGEVTKYWRLDSPKQARDFLKQVRVGPQGNRIEYLEQADGKRVSIDDASDEQVLEVMKWFAGSAKGNSK